MEIAITYNPYIPKTEISIDGVNIEGEYGALFPVRNLPLQCWLGKNGSWPGCAETLAAIVRGSKFRIRFSGRKTDFDDFHQRISEYKWNEEQLQEIGLEECFEASITEKRVIKISNLILNTWNKPYRGIGVQRDKLLISAVYDNLKEMKGATDCIEMNSTDYSSLRDRIKQNNWLCIITYESKDLGDAIRLMSTCHSMKRCSESIVFMEIRNGKPLYFTIDYAQQRKAISDQEMSFLRRKYGYPYKVNTIINHAALIIQNLVDICGLEIEVKEELEMLKLSDDVDDSEYNRVADCARWIRLNKDRIQEAETLIASIWG